MAIRVLHCPTETGRNAWTLAQAEKRLGADSDVMVLSSSWLGYPADIDLRMGDRGVAGKILALSRFLLRAAADYDVLHFNFGRSLLPRFPGPLAFLDQLDLPAFRALGKGIVVTFQGCDVRQRRAAEELFAESACREGECGLCTPGMDAAKARWARDFDRHAHAIFALNPDLLRVLPDRARFLPYTTIEPAEWVPEYRETAPPGGGFTILHAPTNRGIKGTRYLVAAVEALRPRYPDLQLLLVENVPHSQVRELYRRADLVVDQLLVGWYGGFAVEAMALGKPVVCYLRRDDLGYLPPGMRRDLPVIDASPASLETVLAGILERRGSLLERGHAGRRYVERWHDPSRIARRTIRAYERSLAAARGRPGGPLRA